EHHTRHYRINRRRRLDTSPVRRSVGRRGPDHLGGGVDDSGGFPDRVSDLFALAVRRRALTTEQDHTGSVIVNRAPPWARFSARTSPPCNSTRCLTMDSPRPVPPGSRDRDLSTR